MNSGTTAAKEAANMVDLDSDPTKILEVVEIGKQLLITRGSLNTARRALPSGAPCGCADALSVPGRGIRRCSHSLSEEGERAVCASPPPRQSSR